MERYIWFDTDRGRVVSGKDKRGITTDAFIDREKADEAMKKYVNSFDEPEDKLNYVLLLKAEETMIYGVDVVESQD